MSDLLLETHCSTDAELSEEEILRIYGRRWNIEGFFKTCKSFLRLRTECHSLSYDALTVHISLIFVRYMLLAVVQRRNTDDRTLGDLLYLLTDELADVTFAPALQLIVDAMIASMPELFHLSQEQLDALMVDFLTRLPESYRHMLRLQAA